MEEKALTGKARAEEIIKCGNDPIYFFNRYVYISHPKEGLIKFKTYPFQDDCVRQFMQHRFNIILKSRQLGISTVVAAYCLWFALFRRQKNILVIATKLEVAKNFLTKVRQMFDSLPKWLVMPSVEQESMRYLIFSNGSRIIAIPTGKDAGRSEAVSLLVVDEAAHIENFDYHWQGLYATVTHGGQIIVISTPLGVGNKFHLLWEGAITKQNDFNPIKLPWHVHPEHDEEWFKKECNNLGNDPKAIAQELLCDFAASGDTYFGQEEIQYLSDNVKEPVSRFPTNPDVWIWKNPIKDHQYVIAADVAMGNSTDYSAFCVADLNENEIVCEYKGKIAPDNFADLLMEVGYFYNSAVICNERNTFGLVVSYKLRDNRYPNLYYEKYAKNGVYQKNYNVDPEDIPGFMTTGKTRLAMLAKLEQLIRNRKIKIYSSRFLSETKTFLWRNNKAEAQRGYTDDLIIAMSILCYISNIGEDEKINEEEIKYMEAMKEAWSRSVTPYSVNPITMPIMTGKNAMPIEETGFYRGSLNAPRAINNVLQSSNIMGHFQDPNLSDLIQLQYEIMSDKNKK